MNNYLIHWGRGYNQCPGCNISHLEFSKLAATLARDYDMEYVNPKKEWDWKSRFLAVPYGWPVYIKRRHLNKDWRETNIFLALPQRGLRVELRDMVASTESNGVALSTALLLHIRCK